MSAMTMLANGAAVHVATNHSAGWDRPGWWPIFPLLWFVVIGTIVFFAVRRRSSPRGAGMAVLGERYARGEIDEAEFQQRRDVLRKK